MDLKGTGRYYFDLKNINFVVFSAVKTKCNSSTKTHIDLTKEVFAFFSLYECTEANFQYKQLCTGKQVLQLFLSLSLFLSLYFSLFHNISFSLSLYLSLAHFLIYYLIVLFAPAFWFLFPLFLFHTFFQNFSLPLFLSLRNSLYINNFFYCEKN